MTNNLLSIVTFDPSVTISEIFIVRPSSWQLEQNKVKCRYVNRTSVHRYVNRTSVHRYVNRTPVHRYVNRTSVHGFIFDSNSNFLPCLSPCPRYFQSECAWSWPWPLECVKIKCKYDNWMPIHDFLFDCTSNVFRICRHFQDIHSWNMHGLDLDRYNWSRSNVKMSIECQHSTSYLQYDTDTLSIIKINI